MPDNSTTQTGKSNADAHQNPVSKGIHEAVDQAKFQAHKAAPGPAVPQNMPEQEGTKEERQAKAQALNK
ncbi:hypothetical protein F5B22DRAFT_467637 [Xylaria bambusicola]|uniref:uncharacterized protein n=1 Tax=Xylaria bambusicola TaxID=326684 RepID=UPI002007BEE0|nr:uncharacterized protein F5B22DRAFT_467637 [Xylaria bambusicola]KAI0522264.1 hypothetical protein F5B22DRAFT_467637 [Xylaria bambusicola]